MVRIIYLIILLHATDRCTYYIIQPKPASSCNMSVMIKIAYKSLKGTIKRLDVKYILHGGFWLSASQGVSLVAVLATSYVFANYVDVTDYGLYKYILSLSAIFAVLSLTGMAQSVVQATARGYYSFINIGYKKALLYGLTTTCIGIIAAIYYYLNQNIPIAIGCLFIAFLVPFINSGQLIYSQLQGLKRFSLSAKLQSIKIIINATAVVATIFLTENIIYYIAVYFLSNALVSVGIYVFTQNRLRLPQDIDSSDATQTTYLSYAKHSSARDILTGLAYEVDKILAFQMLGATQLAIYAFAIAIPEQCKGIFKNLALLILVKFTGYDLKGIKKNLFKKVFLLGVILLILTIVYIAIAPYIYTILFPQYTDSIILSQIFALSFLPMVAIFPLSALQAQMREKDLHALNIGTAVVLIISLYIGVTFFGLMGLIVSRVIVRYGNAIATFLLLYRK